MGQQFTIQASWTVLCNTSIADIFPRRVNRTLPRQQSIVQLLPAHNRTLLPRSQAYSLSLYGHETALHTRTSSILCMHTLKLSLPPFLPLRSAQQLVQTWMTMMKRTTRLPRRHRRCWTSSRKTKKQTVRGGSSSHH